jgi:hypothetical protein
MPTMPMMFPALQRGARARLVRASAAGEGRTDTTNRTNELVSAPFAAPRRAKVRRLGFELFLPWPEPSCGWGSRG